LINSVLGLVVGGGTVWLIRIIGHYAMGREAMGFGDVTLMAMIGSFLGWQPSLVVFFMLAPLCALAVTLVIWLVTFIRSSLQFDRAIPFGPYLSIGALAILFFWKSYFSSFATFFSRGPFLLMVFVLMAMIFFPLLVLLRFIKHSLGFEDAWIDEEIEEWTSGDQLTFYANKEERSIHVPLQQPSWPGVSAGQGTAHTNRWRGTK
jgi:leader peptidase (prepilin peptidase)/N-methyltransferase